MDIIRHKFKKPIAWILIAVSVFAVVFSSALFYWNTSVKAATTGYFTFQIYENGVCTTDLRINVVGDYVTNKSINVTYAIASGTNGNNVRLTSTSGWTQQSNTGAYGVVNIGLEYTQKAHYRCTTFNTSGGYSGERFTFRYYAANVNDGAYSVDTDMKDAETVLQTNITATLRSFGIGSGNHGTAVLTMERPTYTATFNGNGNSGGATDTQWRLRGDNFNLNNGFWRDGHNFSHWTDQYGAVYYDGWTRGADQDMAFTANWSPWQHTVAYNANGGWGEPGAQTKTYGSLLYLSNTVPSRTGYSFAYWTGDNNVGSYAPGAAYGADFNGGTVTMYAQWSANQYTVSYNANGGSGNMSSDTATYDSAFSIKSNAFTRTGYEFVGWNDKADGTGNNWTGWSGTWTRTSGLTVYAQWKAVNYTIKYDANGGTGSMGNQTAQRDIALNLSANNFARPTYTFLGWSKDKDAATASYANGQSVTNIGPANETVTLYAVWKKTDASFDTLTIIHDENMFTGDGKLVGGAGTTYDKNNVDSKYAHVDDANNPGYFTRR